MFGHNGEECRKNPQARQEWRPILRQASQEIVPIQSCIDEEGFITVRKRIAAPVTGHKVLLAPTHVQNSFGSLAETDGPALRHHTTEGGDPL